MIAQVPQEALPRDLQRTITADFRSPSDAQACLEVLDTAVSFLQGTGGTLMQTLDKSIGSMLLSQVGILKLGLWRKMRDAGRWDFGRRNAEC